MKRRDRKKTRAWKNEQKKRKETVPGGGGVKCKYLKKIKKESERGWEGNGEREEESERKRQKEREKENTNE